MLRRTTKRLEGLAKLTDDREFNANVRYQLIYTFEESNLPEPTCPNATNDLVTGRFELVQAGPSPAVESMNLNFEMEEN